MFRNDPSGDAMNGQPTLIPKQPTPVPPTRECRVYERHPCDLQTSCQPPSFGTGKESKWQGSVRDISTGGIGLVLRRRFERGTGLVIELPGGDEPTTVLVRVVHVKAQPGGAWALGCVFVSPLSDEELNALLHSTPGTRKVDPAERPVSPSARTASAPPPVPAPAPATLADVYLRGTLPEGVVIERLIRRLDLPATWPLKSGQILGIRTKGKNAPTVVRMRVDFCGRRGGLWALHVTFLDATPVDILRAFGPSYPVRH